MKCSEILKSLWETDFQHLFIPNHSPKKTTTTTSLNQFTWSAFVLKYVHELSFSSCISQNSISLVCGTCTCVTSVPRSIPPVLSVLFSFPAPLKSNLTIMVSGSARGRVQTMVKYKLQQALTRPCWTLSYQSVSTSSPLHLIQCDITAQAATTSECVWTCCLILTYFFCCFYRHLLSIRPWALCF